MLTLLDLADEFCRAQRLLSLGPDARAGELPALVPRRVRPPGAGRGAAAVVRTTGRRRAPSAGIGQDRVVTRHPLTATLAGRGRRGWRRRRDGPVGRLGRGRPRRLRLPVDHVRDQRRRARSCSALLPAVSLVRHRHRVRGRGARPGPAGRLHHARRRTPSRAGR